MPGYEHLYQFQKEGVAFLLDSPKELNYCNHRYLADDCGLGKTVQACVAMVEAGVKTALLIVPSNHKETWARQLIDWGVCAVGDIGIVKTRIDYPAGKFVIVSYELLLSAPLRRALLKKTFDVVVVDEAHRVRNGGKIADYIIDGRDALICRSTRRWLLSATSMANRPIDLYAPLATLAPQLIKGFNKRDDYGRQFCAAYHDGRGLNFSGASDTVGLARRARPFILRREVKDVYEQLPPVLENEVYLDVGVLDADESNTPMATLRKIVGQAKAPHTVDYIKEWLSDNDKQKVLVYAYHQEFIENVTVALADFGAVKYYGPMSAKEKLAAIEQFTKNKSCRVLVGQLAAIGESVDGLQYACNNIIDAELDWAEHGDRQQVGRLHRFGQDKTVYRTKLVANKTLDDAQLRSVFFKRKVVNMFYRTVKERSNMSIEESLSRIATAVETIALYASGGPGGVIKTESTPKQETAEKPKAASKPAKAADSAPAAAAAAVPSSEELKAVVVAALKKQGGQAPAQAKVGAVIKNATEGRANLLKEVTEADRAAVIAGLQSLLTDDEDALGV